MQDGSRRVCHNLLGCLMSHAVQFVLQAILCDSESCPNHYINGPTPQLVLGPTSLPLPDETTNNKFTSNVQQQCLTHTPTPSPLESSSTSSCKGFNNALNRATRWKAVEYGQRSWLITNESATFHILAVKHVLSHTRTVWSNILRFLRLWKVCRDRNPMFHAILMFKQENTWSKSVWFKTRMTMRISVILIPTGWNRMNICMRLWDSGMYWDVFDFILMFSEGQRSLALLSSVGNVSTEVKCSLQFVWDEICMARSTWRMFICHLCPRVIDRRVNYPAGCEGWVQ